MSDEKEIKKRKRSRGNGEGSVYYSESKKKWVAQYTTGKGEDGKQRRKTFYADTRKAVKAKLEAYEYAPNDLGALFVTRRGGNYVSTNAVNTQLQRTCAKYEIAEKVDAHMLRHTFATRCIEVGVSAKALQKILGHADITVTLNTYCDVFDRFEAENNSRLAEYFKQSGLDFGS